LTKNELRTRTTKIFLGFFGLAGNFLSSFGKMAVSHERNFDFRTTHILLAGARPYAPDPIFGLPEGNS